MIQKKRILVVDDEIPVCSSIVSALDGLDYTVDTALSGEEAVAKHDEGQYDLVITDLMMPSMSGMDLLKSLMQKNPETRVIMITGYPSTQSVSEAVRFGAVSYLAKPFTPEDLRTLVQSILETRQ